MTCRRLGGVLLAAVLLLTAGAVPASAAVNWWRPKASAAVRWQIQFTGALDTSVEASVFDVDGDGTTAAQVRALHRRGAKVICYVSAGSYENWRADADKFPASVLGADLQGWPGEKWLDIRQWKILGPIMTARFQACRKKGFDAVDPDNLDGYTNANGLGLTAADQLAYNRHIAATAHALALAVGLKNDLGQVKTLVGGFDFAINEQCAYYQECALLKPFIKAGKPVFEIEYEVTTSSFCPASTKLGFAAIRKRTALSAWRQTCPA